MLEHSTLHGTVTGRLSSATSRMLELGPLSGVTTGRISCQDPNGNRSNTPKSDDGMCLGLLNLDPSDLESRAKAAQIPGSPTN